MAPYKTFFIFFILGMTSVLGLTISRLTSAEDDSNARGGKDFKFSDDYFNNDKESEGTANQETLKNCEKVIKNGMICLVCKEPENNGNYEQCAYVSHPRKKLLSYQKRKPEPDIDEIETKSDNKKQQPARRRLETEESDEYFINLPKKVDKSNEKDSGDEEDDDNENQKNYSSDYASEFEKTSKSIEDDDCEEVEKDGMTCMECKNTKTGGKYEKCTSAYQPKDKVYKFSTSKSFGYPSKSKSPKKEKSQSYKHADEKVYKPESEEVVEEKSDSVNCRTIVKDSMTCQVCLDPHTQENSEQCSYSYDPDDKVYAYSKSRSFGTPKKYRK